VQRSSFKSFWLVRAVKALARWVVEKILVLYYVGTDPKVPLWAKRALLGALIYIFSLGIALDFLPVIGEVDDVVAFVVATVAVLFAIKPHHKLQAQEKARHWFGGPPPTPAVPPVLPPPPLS
jgi:uncharacterized membrane protein YkvA (DUF1232 family)